MVVGEQILLGATQPDEHEPGAALVDSLDDRGILLGRQGAEGPETQLCPPT